MKIKFIDHSFELKGRNNMKLTEYILIGTLLSFGLAILAGLLYVQTLEP